MHSPIVNDYGTNQMTRCHRVKGEACKEAWETKIVHVDDFWENIEFDIDMIPNAHTTSVFREEGKKDNNHEKNSKDFKHNKNFVLLITYVPEDTVIIPAGL